MNVSGAVDLSLTVKEDGEVYFAIYNAGESLQVTLKPSTAESKGSEDDSMDTNVPLIAGICGFFAVAILGVIIGCIVFTCKRRHMPRFPTQVQPELSGIPQDKVESLYPQRRFDQLVSFSISETCSVCLERFKASSEIRILPCKHVYHTACIDLWFRNNHVPFTQICCLCKLDCQHFTEDSEMETSIFDKQLDKPTLPEVLVESLDDTVVDHKPQFRRDSLLNGRIS